ncbi:hypothetical protein ACFFIS_09015 [Virgibacillus soli]|uniref:Uncharacterized protein n=1 Tax=Paracerasibacillus soli TaxID=480284 RepID=A0ABU5CQ54_9BACI|nr:hypothetical protein [Virgibacillus soli]MDY0407590.1 hypothetical protein [Virgibacillus soli]
MLFEIVSDFLLATSPFYFYISLFLSALAVLKFIHFDLHHYLHHNIYSKRAHTIDIHVLHFENQVEQVSEIRDWIAQKIKRIESPDDDTDGHPLPLNTLLTHFRGGILWKKDLYSHFLRNMASSRSFFLFSWRGVREI